MYEGSSESKFRLRIVSGGVRIEAWSRRRRVNRFNLCLSVRCGGWSRNSTCSSKLNQMVAASETPAAAIDSPADCEVRAVIRFIWAKKIKPAEIHRELCSVYGENIMSDSAVRKWCRLFGEGRTNVHDEERSGRPSVVNDDLVEKINQKVRENRKFTITQLSECFLRSHELSSTKLWVKNLGTTNFVLGGCQNSWQMLTKWTDKEQR